VHRHCIIFAYSPSLAPPAYSYLEHGGQSVLTEIPLLTLTPVPALYSHIFVHLPPEPFRALSVPLRTAHPPDLCFETGVTTQPHSWLHRLLRVLLVVQPCGIMARLSPIDSQAVADDRLRRRHFEIT
jgi:hypothetical protein